MLIKDEVIPEDEAFIEDAGEEEQRRDRDSQGEEDRNAAVVNDDEQEEEEDDAPEQVQYQFISKELVFTAGGDGKNVLEQFRESRFHEESTILHRHEESHQRDSDQRRVIDMDDEDDREALAE